MGYTLKTTLDCNGECRSCYEAVIRGKGKTPYNFPAISAAVEKIIEQEKPRKEKGLNICSPPTLHGGEPLLMKFNHLETLVKKIHGFWGYGGIQTNGLLLNDRVLDLFQEYKFNLGVSLDGDTAELNFGRWNARKRDGQFIQEKTDLVIDNMRKAHGRKIQISLIVVLRKYNATPDRIWGLIEFLYRMWKEFEIEHVRTNAGVVYDPALREEEELSGREYGFALEKIHNFILTHPALRYRPFIDIADLMLGNFDQTCTFNQCDAFKTSAEQAINHEGEITNCLHPAMAVEGVQALQADLIGKERYQMLYSLSQELGGCQGCKYWHICNGGCPGAGIDNDWRNRSRFCEGYKMIFRKFETLFKSLMPNLYLVPEFYPAKPTPAETQFALRTKKPSIHRKDLMVSIEKLKDNLKNNGQAQGSDHGDSHTDKHGDAPHGDHTDYSRSKK